MENYLSLGQEESGIMRDPAGSDPIGGLVVFFEFLRRIGYCEVVRQHLPFSLRSPNAIDPVKTSRRFLLSVVAGARRFTHTSLLRADTALASAVGNLPVSHRRRGSQRVQTLRAGPVSAFFLGLVKLAVRTTNGMRLGLQLGCGFYGVRALRSPARCVARTQPTQTWPAIAFSAARSLARLAAQRQLRHLAQAGGVFEASVGVVARKTRASRGACGCRLF